MIEPQHWRVGEKVPLNVYLNDKPMFQCHTPEDAAMVVEALNFAAKSRANSAKNEPQQKVSEALKQITEEDCYCQGGDYILKPDCTICIAREALPRAIELEQAVAELQDQLARYYRERDDSIAKLAAANERLIARVAELLQALNESHASFLKSQQERDRLREALKGCLNELEGGISAKLLDRIGAAHAALNPTEPA